MRVYVKNGAARLLGSLILLMLSVLGFGQAQTESFNITVGSRQCQGEWQFVQHVSLEGGRLPMSCTVYAQGLTSPAPSHNWSIEIAQTHTFVAGTLVKLPNDLSIFQATGGNSASGVATQVDSLLSVLYNWVSATNAGNGSRKTGRFRFGIYLYQSSVATPISKKEYTFDVKVYNFFEGQNNFDPSTGQPTTTTGGGGVGSNSPTETGQRSFWGTIFVPQQSSINNLRDAAQNFRQWGPFGIATELGEKMNGQSSTLPGGSCPYCFQLTNSALTGPVVVDMTPMAPWIKVVRMLILMFLVWRFGMSLIRWITKSKTGGDDE